MGSLKNDQFESGTIPRCAVTGLAIHSRPDWTDVDFGKAYRITVTLIGDCILVIRASGYATLPDIKHELSLTDRILAEVIPADRTFVVLEDMSNVIGSSRQARKYFIDNIKKRARPAGLVFYGVSPLFRLSLNLAKQLNIFKINLKIAADYAGAVNCAREMLSFGQTESKTSSTDTNAYPHDRTNGDMSPHRIVSRPGWSYQTENFSIRYEVINENILHAVTTGRFEKANIHPAFRLKENAIQSAGQSAGSYYYVLGMNESQGTSQKARKCYVDAILAFYRKYPFRMFIFYGVSRLLHAGIVLGSSLVPFPVRVVKDLDSALALIAKQKTKLPESASHTVPAGSHNKSDTHDQVRQYVDELVQYIEGVNWEIDGIQVNGEKESSHPFAPVFGAIDLIKWELDDLLKARNEAAEQLRQAKEAAEFANRAKSDFLANMSHELRTPLNHIIGFTELVVDKKCGGLNATQQEYLGDVLTSSRYLLSLINDILDLSKVEAGRLELEPSAVNLKMLLENSLVMIREKAIKNGIQLSTDMDKIPETITADERKLKQIVYNLLSNAVKFTPDGGRICLKAKLIQRSNDSSIPQSSNAFIQISVEDTGIGIKAEDLARIFSPFEQVEDSAGRRFQGTGLGLSLTQRLVELHGGRIRAESAGPGRGCTFKFVIPQ